MKDGSDALVVTTVGFVAAIGAIVFAWIDESFDDALIDGLADEMRHARSST